MISSALSETKASVDEVRHVFTKQILENIRLASSFSGKDLTVMESVIRSLKRWTGKASANIIYDSRVDPFTDQSLSDKVKGKSNIAVVAFTTEGDVFGGFYSVAVTEQGNNFADPNMFLFSFESHGRCAAPKRFTVKSERRGGANVRFYNNDSDGWFVRFDSGPGWLYLGDQRVGKYCDDLSKGFDGIANNTLTGNTYPARFACSRLVAIQLE